MWSVLSLVQSLHWRFLTTNSTNDELIIIVVVTITELTCHTPLLKLDLIVNNISLNISIYLKTFAMRFRPYPDCMIVDDDVDNCDVVVNDDTIPHVILWSLITRAIFSDRY